MDETASFITAEDATTKVNGSGTKTTFNVLNMEINNLNSPTEDKINYCVQDTFSPTDRNNPPTLVPYRNDTCVLDSCEVENSSPPHLLPEIIVTRTKLNKVNFLPEQTVESDILIQIKNVPEIEITRTKINKTDASSLWTQTEALSIVSQPVNNTKNCGSEEPKISSKMQGINMNSSPEWPERNESAVLGKNNVNIVNELNLEPNNISSKQALVELNTKLKQSSETGASIKSSRNQQTKAHQDGSQITREQIVSHKSQSFYSAEDESVNIIKMCSKKIAKKMENNGKLAIVMRREGSMEVSHDDNTSSNDAAMVTSVSKEKGHIVSEDNRFGYPHYRLSKMLDLHTTQSARSSSKSNGCVMTNFNQKEHGSFNSCSVQNKNCETTVNYEHSTEQMAKNIFNDLVNKAVKNCDQKKPKCSYVKQAEVHNKCQSYYPSENIWIAAHEEYKKSTQIDATGKKLCFKSGNLQSILKSKQKPSNSDDVTKCEKPTESDIHRLCTEPNELKVDVRNGELLHSSSLAGKQSNTVRKDDKRIIEVKVVENNVDKTVMKQMCSALSLCSLEMPSGQDVNKIQLNVEKATNFTTKSHLTLAELQNNKTKDNLMLVDSFGRNLLPGYNASWSGNMEPSFSGRESHVSPIPDRWSEIDDDEDEDEEDEDKSDEYLNLPQRISTGKEERDTIDGVEFLAFETERDMVEFTKIEQDIQCFTSFCDQGMHSDDGLGMMDDSFISCGDNDAGNIHQAIVPTKTKDITKIKGWRNKQFAINNNPSHCISNNSNGPYEDDDGFESLDVKIQDEVNAEEEPEASEASIDIKGNIDIEDNRVVAAENPANVDVLSGGELIKSETSFLMQTEPKVDEKIKKAAFVSDEAEKFFSEFVSPDIALDVPQFKPEEVTVCQPASNLLRLSPKLQKLPPRKPVTFWRTGPKFKTLAEKQKLMEMKLNPKSKRKVGRPRRKLRGRPRIHPRTSDSVNHISKNWKKNLVTRSMPTAVFSYDLDPEYKYTWVAGKPIRITGSKKQMLMKNDDWKQGFESTTAEKNNVKLDTTEMNVYVTEIISDNKLQINEATEPKTLKIAEVTQKIKKTIKSQGGETEVTFDKDIQMIEEFNDKERLPEKTKPSNSLQESEETKVIKGKIVQDMKLCGNAVVKLGTTGIISEENKLYNYIHRRKELKLSTNSNLIGEIKSIKNTNAVQETTAKGNPQVLKENKSVKNAQVNEEIKWSGITKAAKGTNQDNSSKAVNKNKLENISTKVSKMQENSKSQLMKNTVQKAKKNENNNQTAYNKDMEDVVRSLSEVFASEVKKEYGTQILVNPCVGIPLHPLAIKTLMAVRSKNTLIDETWAKFSVSVVTSTDYISAIARAKNRARGVKKSSSSSHEGKPSEVVTRMKTRGNKVVNYRESTRIIGQSALKKGMRIPISGVVTRNRFAVMSEMQSKSAEKDIFLKSKVDNSKESNLSTSLSVTSKKLATLQESCSTFSEKICTKPKMSITEETKKASFPTSSKKLSTLPGLCSEIYEKEDNIVLKTKNKENEASQSSSRKSKNILTCSETCNKSDNNEHFLWKERSQDETCNNISEVKDFGTVETADAKEGKSSISSTTSNKRLAALIEMCSKTADTKSNLVCEVNDEEKSQTSKLPYSKCNVVNEADMNLSDDEKVSFSSSAGSRAEMEKEVHSNKESCILLERDDEWENRTSALNGKETATKILDKISVKEHELLEINSKEQKVLLSSASSEKEGLTSNKINHIPGRNKIKLKIRNKKHVSCSKSAREICSKISDKVRSAMPETNTKENKLASFNTIGKQRLFAASNMYGDSNSEPPNKRKIEANKTFSLITQMSNNFCTMSEVSTIENNTISKIENSERSNKGKASAKLSVKKGTVILPSDIDNRPALLNANTEEMSPVGESFVDKNSENTTFSSHVKKNGRNILSVCSGNIKAGFSKDLDAEIKGILEDMLNCVVCHEIQDLVIKDDPDGHINAQLITSISPKKYRKKTKLNRELTRISANLIVMSEEDYEAGRERVKTETQILTNCKNEFCRLGCICSSLHRNNLSTLSDHCGKPSCMFECSCTSRIIGQNDKDSREEYGGKYNSRLYRTAFHLLDQGSRHLAKVEKEFRHTVIHSGKETVVVGGGSSSDGGRRRREIKLPERYKDYNVAIGKEFALAEFKMISADTAFETCSSDNGYKGLPSYVEVEANQTVPVPAPAPARKKLKPLRGKLTLDQKMTLSCERYGIKPCFVHLNRLSGLDGVMPWCMIHMMYDCFCGGFSTRFCKKVAHSYLERPPPVFTSQKNLNDKSSNFTLAAPNKQKISRNKAIKSTTLASMHTHDVDLYSARTKGATFNYALRNKSQYFKHKVVKQQENIVDQNAVSGTTESCSSQSFKAYPEISLAGQSVIENCIHMDHTEFNLENVAQNEDIGFGKIVSITTLKPEEFEKCGTTEEVNEEEASERIENEEFTGVFNSETVASMTNVEDLCAIKDAADTVHVKASHIFCSSTSSRTSNELEASSVNSLIGNGKDSYSARLAKLISMKDSEIRALLKKGECSLNLSQYDKCAIQLVKWPVLCKKFRNADISIWVHSKHSSLSKIFITEKGLEPNIYSINLHNYFPNNQAALPHLIRTMMEDLILEQEEYEKNANAYALLYCDGENWELVGCMHRIREKSNDQERTSESKYAEVQKKCLKKMEMQEEDVSEPVLAHANMTLDNYFNKQTNYKSESKKPNCAGIFETVDSRKYVQINSGFSMGSSTMLDVNNSASSLQAYDKSYPPKKIPVSSAVYQSNSPCHNESLVFPIPNSNSNSSAVSDKRENLTLAALLDNEDFQCEANSTEKNTDTPTQSVTLSSKTSISEDLTLAKLLNNEDFKLEMKRNEKNIAYQAPLPVCSFPCRWYMFAIETAFDILRFYKQGRSFSYTQLQEAINLANTKHKTVRLSIGSEANLPKSTDPKFGVYAVPNICSYIFIGPYELEEEIGFCALKAFNGTYVDTHVTLTDWNDDNDMQEIQRNHGVWYYALTPAKKSVDKGTEKENENRMEMDLEKSVNLIEGKSKRKHTLTMQSMNALCPASSQIAQMQKETISQSCNEEEKKEELDTSSKSRRKQTLIVRSLNPLYPSSSKSKQIQIRTMSSDENTPQGRPCASSSEELDVVTPCDVSSMVQEMKDDMERSTAEYRNHARAATIQEFPDSTSSIGDSIGEFKMPSLHCGPKDPSTKRPGKGAVPVRLVPSISSLGFVPASMYHNKTIQLINPFADYREAKLFKNLSNLTTWLSCEVKRRVKCVPEDLKIIWRVKQAVQNIKDCKQFNPQILDGSYTLTEKGLVRMHQAKQVLDVINDHKKIELLRNFYYLKQSFMAKDEGLKLSKLGIIQKAIEEIQRLVRQNKNMLSTVIELKQQRLNTFKKFCCQLKGFTNEEKRAAMVCLKNVMRKQTIPIVDIEDDDEDDKEINKESRSESTTEDLRHHSSDDSSIEDYLGDDNSYSKSLKKETHVLLFKTMGVENMKENGKGNSNERHNEEEDDKPLSALLLNNKTSGDNKPSSLAGNVNMQMSLQRTDNDKGTIPDNSISESVEKENKIVSKENMQQFGSAAQMNIDESDSVSISIVTDGQPVANEAVTSSCNGDVVTVTYIAQDSQHERSTESTKLETKNLTSSISEQNSAVSSSVEIKESKSSMPDLHQATPVKLENSQKEHLGNADKQESELLALLQDGEKIDENNILKDPASGAKDVAMDVRIPEPTSSSQFIINGKVINTNTGTFCYKIPPLLTQRNSLSVSVGLDQSNKQQMTLLKRAWIQENSVNSLAQSGEKKMQTFCEPPPKVRIISAPEEWKRTIVTTNTSFQNNRNLNMANVRPIGVQTSKSLLQTTKPVNVPVLPAFVLPNNNNTVNKKLGYHILTKGGANFKIVQTHQKVDRELTATSQSSVLSKSAQQSATRRPVTILPAPTVHNMANSGQKSAAEKRQSLIKLHTLTGVKMPNIKSPNFLKSVFINGQKVYVQNAKGAYPLLVASPKSNGGPSTLLNTSSVISSVPINKPGTSTNSSSASDRLKCNSELSSASCSSSMPKPLFVSSSNHPGVLKTEVTSKVSTANSYSVSPLKSGSKTFLIKGNLAQPFMVQVVNTKKPTIVSKAPSASTMLNVNDVKQTVNLKSPEFTHSSPKTEEISKDCTEASSCCKTDSSKLISEMLNDDSSVKERVSGKMSKIITESVSNISTKVTEVVKESEHGNNMRMINTESTTEDTSIKTENSKSKFPKLDLPEAKKKLKVRSGVITRLAKQTKLRTKGMTTRSSLKQVKS